VRSAFALAVMACIFASAPVRSGIAQEACAEPPQPAPVDGAQVSEQQMRAAADAARNFIAQSDVYQACLSSALQAARTEASARGKPLDPGLETVLRAKADANQKVKEKVGFEINTAMDVYKQTHLK
jgi:hypothetical protein